jgi:hypothetical protein
MALCGLLLGPVALFIALQFFPPRVEHKAVEGVLLGYQIGGDLTTRTMSDTAHNFLPFANLPLSFVLWTRRKAFLSSPLRCPHHVTYPHMGRSGRGYPRAYHAPGFIPIRHRLS